jgi:hypothetical protein
VEEGKSPVADIRRVMIRLFNELELELKGNIENNSMNPRRTWIKKSQ